MQHPGFFERAGPFPLSVVAKAAKAELATEVDSGREIDDVRTLADAGPAALSFLDNRKYLPQFETTRAGACLVSPRFAERAPPATACLLTTAPYRGFALALRLFYPEAMLPKTARAGAPLVDPTAELEEGVLIEPGAVIGPEARIGRGSRIAAGALVGYRVHVGRDCYIGPQVCLTHALIGDRVVIHAGSCLGQDGFGFAMGREGHLKVPQIGRVIVQDDVEIGANAAVDRGALNDTIIGEGTKIDNLVQIAHNVVIGRHCVIAGHAGISGSTELGDFVVMGGQSGMAGHLEIGAGAQIAGGAHPIKNVPPGARVGGTPARPLRQWGRELAYLAKVTRHQASNDPEDNQ